MKANWRYYREPAADRRQLVTDLTEHQPQAQIANAQNAIQAQIRVVGDDTSGAVRLRR